MKLGICMAVLGAILMTNGAQGAERSLVVPRDDKPFAVDKDDVVRLTGKGIAGSAIKATATGPAEIIAENSVSERAGGHRMIGSTTKEFELKSSGTGTVKVTITVTPPQPGSKPIVTTYEYTVN